MATAKKVNKAAQVRAYQAKNPDASAIKVAKACNTNPAYVYAIRASDKNKATKTPKQQWKMLHISTNKEAIKEKLKAMPLTSARKAEIERQIDADQAYELTKGRDRVETPITMEEPEQPLAGTDAMLAERGSRYGKFADHANITQMLKACIQGHARQHGKEMSAAQREALDMIAHKIGRIVNGDPNYVDSWRDIEGYAKLVADELETGKQV